MRRTAALAVFDAFGDHRAVHVEHYAVVAALSRLLTDHARQVLRNASSSTAPLGGAPAAIGKTDRAFSRPRRIEIAPTPTRPRYRFHRRSA